MIQQRFLKCGVAAAFLFGFVQSCFAADTDVSSAPATAIHGPTSDWTVGQLSAMNTNGLGYCSMKNNFQTGQSLVFARDNQGENSIALDFHKNVFKSGDIYNVKTRVGAVTRRLDALAATQQVLVMQTGIDTELYSALGHRHNVVFTIKKTNYGFELDASATDALNALKHCSESFQSGTKFSQATFPLGKVSDMAALEQADEEDNVAAIADDEQPAPAKNHHQHKHIAKASDPVQVQPATVQAAAAPATVVISSSEASATPSPAQQDTVRDDVKAEIASEIINMRSNEQQPTSSSLPSVMPAAGVNGTTSVLAPIRTTSAESADLRGLLQRSRVASGQQIQTAGNGTLRWTADDLYGSARQMSLAPGESLTDAANEYLRKAASICKGDFAKKLGAPKKAGQVDVLEADITCLDGQNNAAAAVLFIGNTDGRASVITQEGTIDQLTSAMTARDAIISAAARSGKRASNDLGILHGHDPGLQPDTPQATGQQLASADTGPPIKLLKQTANPSSPPPSSSPPILASSHSSPPTHSSPSPPPSPDTLALLTPAAGSQQQSPPQQISLATPPGAEFGIDASRYKYREVATTNPFVDSSGYKGGVDLAYTSHLSLPSSYLRGEFRYAAGPVDYSSAEGTASGQKDDLWEMRGLIGNDFVFNNFALSPYTGYGFRYLYNVASTIGPALGYRRQSTYQYVPIGLTTRLGLIGQTDLATNFEYDLFTEGTEKSYLSDVGPPYTNQVNHQREGQGLRGSLLFEIDGWSAGPWFNYWRIGESDIQPEGDEPDNTTKEVGFKIAEHI